VPVQDVTKTAGIHAWVVIPGTGPGAPVALGAPDYSPLFPPSRTRRRIEHWLTEALADARVRLQSGKVAASVDRTVRSSELAGFDFTAQQPLEQLLPWVIDQMEHGLVQVTHPRYFGLFNPAPTFPAECADRITALFNPQLATATTSPFPVELEAHVIRAIADRVGLPTGSTGHFTSGGSEANYTAVICALTHAHPGFAAEGARAFPGKPLIYASRESHLAWLKIAHQAGIGRDAVRLVATDGEGRMDSASLAAALAADVASGHVPILVAATAGTTGGGMIDPLTECSAIARQYGAWFHVDAAWGGAAIASDRLRGLLAGIEKADSVTIDAHKWLATTMGCGMFLTARPAIQNAAFQVVMDCMPSNIPTQDPYVTTAQWSRRFVGLRLFLALASAGWAGYARHIEHSIALADLASELLIHAGWRRVNKSALGVLCLQPPASAPAPRALARSVVQSGVAWISAASFEEQDVVRICVTNGETNEDDVVALVHHLKSFG
jgi:aromatic-L-amino-acid/L-tryptophan decarboxylase